MLFINFLRYKDEAPQALKQFIVDVALIGKSKEPNTDNGGEYVGQAFKQLLLQLRISLITKVPYSSYQNGKAKAPWGPSSKLPNAYYQKATLTKVLDLRIKIYSTHEKQKLQDSQHSNFSSRSNPICKTFISLELHAPTTYDTRTNFH